jgi:hypothetical protein
VISLLLHFYHRSYNCYCDHSWMNPCVHKSKWIFTVKHTYLILILLLIYKKNSIVSWWGLHLSWIFSTGSEITLCLVQCRESATMCPSPHWEQRLRKQSHLFVLVIELLVPLGSKTHIARRQLWRSSNLQSWAQSSQSPQLMGLTPLHWACSTDHSILYSPSSLCLTISIRSTCDLTHLHDYLLWLCVRQTLWQVVPRFLGLGLIFVCLYPE